MKIICAICDCYIKEPGAIILTPAIDHVVGYLPLCMKCWRETAKKLNIEAKTETLVKLAAI